MTKKSPVVCDGYVKYEETEVDRLVAILKKQITAAAEAAAVVDLCGIQ